MIFKSNVNLIHTFSFALQTILNDWNSGKIKYYTHPPETVTKETHVSAEVVTTFAKEFSLDNLDKMDQDEISNLPELKPSETMAIASSGMVLNINQEDQEEMAEEDNDEEEDDDMEENVDENVGQLSKRLAFNAKSKAKAKSESEVPKFQAEGLVKMKKAAKMREKKERKDRRRRAKVATELSEGLDNAFEALGKSEKYIVDQDYEM